MNYCLIDAPALTLGKVEIREEVLKENAPIAQKFYDMGIRKNTSIQVIGFLPFSRNLHIEAQGESFILRENEARCLEVNIS